MLPTSVNSLGFKITLGLLDVASDGTNRSAILSWYALESLSIFETHEEMRGLEAKALKCSFC